jgi:hypothetical protein
MPGFGDKSRLESRYPPPILCMDQGVCGVDNFVADRQGVGQPFREIEERLLPLTPKARPSAGADGWEMPQNHLRDAILMAASLGVS